MNPELAYRLFKDTSDAWLENPTQRPTNLRRCDECTVYMENVRLCTDNRYRCELHSMNHVTQAMREAARRLDPAPAKPLHDECTFCGHAGQNACRDDNDRVGCRLAQRADR